MSSGRSGKRATDTETHASDFIPLLTRDQWEAGERRYSGSGDIAIARRLTLAVLTKSKADLVSALNNEEEQEAFLQLLNSVATFVEHCEALVDLARAAQARIADVATEFLSTHSG